MKGARSVQQRLPRPHARRAPGSMQPGTSCRVAAGSLVACAQLGVILYFFGAVASLGSPAFVGSPLLLSCSACASVGLKICSCGCCCCFARPLGATMCFGCSSLASPRMLPLQLCWTVCRTCCSAAPTPSPPAQDRPGAAERDSVAPAAPRRRRRRPRRTHGLAVVQLDAGVTPKGRPCASTSQGSAAPFNESTQPLPRFGRGEHAQQVHVHIRHADMHSNTPDRRHSLFFLQKACESAPKQEVRMRGQTL